MITSPVYEEEVSKFLKIKCQVLGVLEILVGLVAFGCVLVNGFLHLLASPVLYVLTGFLTVLAACTRNLCLVRTSQTFNFINIFANVLFFRYTFLIGSLFRVWGVTGIVLMVCDVLVLIFSIVVAATSCSCCCRPKSRSVEVRYMSAAVPVDSVGLLNQSDPSALPQPVVYVLPSAPPPNYSPTTSAPPAYYSRVSTEPPTDCNSVPTSPPPPYDQS